MLTILNKLITFNHTFCEVLADSFKSVFDPILLPSVLFLLTVESLFLFDTVDGLSSISYSSST